MNCFSNRTLLIITGILSLQVGCNLSLSNKPHLRASDYFDDSQVIALCHAIEANDLDRAKRLVQDGVDVNTRGRGNVTPLLWAYLMRELDTFKFLLEQGADPNVVFDDDLDLVTQRQENDSVTHVVCRALHNEYFDAVFDNGGDVDMLGGKAMAPPISTVIRSPIGQKNRIERIQKLIELGCDINKRSHSGATPAMHALAYGSQFEIALLLLKSGADPQIYDWRQKLTHRLVIQERHLKSASPTILENYSKLVSWLEAHGESMEQARQDWKRWDEWSHKYLPEKIRALTEQEIAARKSTEAAKQGNVHDN